LKRTVVDAIAPHSEAKNALNPTLRMENDVKERYLAEHGTLVGSSETLEAIENEIDVALDTERAALLGVFQAATTVLELIAGLQYLHESVRAGDPIMSDHGEELLAAIVNAAEAAAREAAPRKLVLARSSTHDGKAKRQPSKRGKD
jgi:hypothetical protein